MAVQQYPMTAEYVRILGRTLRIDGMLWLGWSASGIAFTTQAAEAAVDILAVTATGDAADYAYLGVIVDGDDAHLRRIRIERGRHSYPILSDGAPGTHRIELIKLSEARNDKIGLVSVTADAPITPAETPAGRILFIGDSMSAGYGIDCADPAHYDGLTTAAENVTRAYSWLTARALGADVQIIAWSGNGIISQTIDPDTDLPVTEDLMPALYPYVDRTTEEIVKIYLSAHGRSENLRELTVFDPRDFVPDVIVTYLGTNDASFTKGIPAREQHFMERYVELQRALQADYPDATRIVLYGSMEQSLALMCEMAAHVTDADYLQLPPIDPATEGTGAGMHPSAIGHRNIAARLTARIRELAERPSSI